MTGLASKKFLESNNCNVLWFSLIKILDSSEMIFTREQYENIKTISEDDMALISSNLTLFQQHLLGGNSQNFLIFLPYFSFISNLLKFFFFILSWPIKLSKNQQFSRPFYHSVFLFIFHFLASPIYFVFYYFIWFCESFRPISMLMLCFSPIFFIFFRGNFFVHWISFGYKRK